MRISKNQHIFLPGILCCVSLDSSLQHAMYVSDLVHGFSTSPCEVVMKFCVHLDRHRFPLMGRGSCPYTYECSNIQNSHILFEQYGIRPLPWAGSHISHACTLSCVAFVIGDRFQCSPFGGAGDAVLRHHFRYKPSGGCAGAGGPAGPCVGVEMVGVWNTVELCRFSDSRSYRRASHPTHHLRPPWSADFATAPRC